MGNCCNKTGKYGAFRHNLDVPLLDDVIPKLSADTKVVIVRLVGMSDIPSSTNYNGLTDAYAEIRLMPNDSVAGGQKQLSSIKPQTLSPSWEPPERFQFIVSKFKDGNSKVVISLYHYNLHNPKKSEALGDAVLKLKDADLSSTPLQKTLKLISPGDGKHKGEVELLVSLESPQEANAEQEHTAYEYQRWQPIILWGSTEPPGHFLPTDPGRWCSEDGKKFDKELEFVTAPVPEGWYVSSPWHTVSTASDPDGWQYAGLIDSPFWHASVENGTFVVRRRTWHREIRRGSGPPATTVGTANPLRSGSISSTGSNAAAGGRRKPMFTKTT